MHDCDSTAWAWPGLLHSWRVPCCARCRDLMRNNEHACLRKGQAHLLAGQQSRSLMQAEGHQAWCGLLDERHHNGTWHPRRCSELLPRLQLKAAALKPALLLGPQMHLTEMLHTGSARLRMVSAACATGYVARQRTSWGLQLGHQQMGGSLLLH